MHLWCQLSVSLSGRHTLFFAVTYEPGSGPCRHPMRFGQGQSLSSHRLASHRVTLWERFVQGCIRVRHKTHITSDEQSVILSSSRTLNYYWLDEMKFAEPLSLLINSLRGKGRDLTQSCDKIPYTSRNVKRAEWQHRQHREKVRFKRLRTDLGRSVGVTTATQLVWLTGLRAQPSPSPQQPCNQKDTFKNL